MVVILHAAPNTQVPDVCDVMIIIHSKTVVTGEYEIKQQETKAAKAQQKLWKRYFTRFFQ